MSDSLREITERYDAFVLDPCANGCSCHHGDDNECLAQKVLTQIGRCEDITWKSSRTLSPGSAVRSIDDITQKAKKMIVLWNKRALCFAEPKSQHDGQNENMEVDAADDEFASSLQKFNYYYQCAHFVQVDKAEGNFLIHVQLEEESAPSYITVWENVINAWKPEYVKKIRRRLLESPLELKDASPSSPLAPGLASTFVLGYLRYKVRAISACQNDHFYRKLIIVVPLSGRCPSPIPGLSVREDGAKMSFCGNAGGVTNRRYETSIYEVPVSGNKTLYVAIEYATPVRALYKMSCATEKSGPTKPSYLPSLGGMSQYWRYEEIKMFHTNLMELIDLEEEVKIRDPHTNLMELIDLEEEVKIRDHVHFVLFDDMDSKHLVDETSYVRAVQQKLKDEIVKAIEQTSEDS